MQQHHLCVMLYTVTYLHTHVLEFTEPDKWLPNSQDLDPVHYSNRWCIVTNVRH